MPAVGAPVVSFLLAAGAGGTVAAVGGAIAVGVVTGAVIGAATSAISGGDVFKGAMKGALVGGVTAGVFSAGSMALTSMTGSSVGMGSAAEQLARYGVTSAATQGIEATVDATAFAPGDTPAAADGLLATGAQPAPVPGTPPVTPEAGMSDSTAKVYAGIGQGAFEGVGKVGAAMMETESNETLAEQKRNDAAAALASNKPGTFETKIANITLPKRWESYKVPTVQQPAGLLSGGA